LSSDRACSAPLLLDLRGARPKVKRKWAQIPAGYEAVLGPVAASLTATTTVPLEPLVGVASLVVRARVQRDVCVSGFRPIVSAPARGGHRRGRLDSELAS